MTIAIPTSMSTATNIPMTVIPIPTHITMSIRILMNILIPTIICISTATSIITPTPPWMSCWR